MRTPYYDTIMEDCKGSTPTPIKMTKKELLEAYNRLMTDNFNMSTSLENLHKVQDQQNRLLATAIYNRDNLEKKLESQTRYNEKLLDEICTRAEEHHKLSSEIDEYEIINKQKILIGKLIKEGRDIEKECTKYFNKGLLLGVFAGVIATSALFMVLHFILKS